MLGVPRSREYVRRPRSPFFAVPLAAFAILAIGGSMHPAKAGLVLAASSEGAAISSTLKIAGVADGTLEVNQLKATAPGAYSTSTTLASANASAGAFGFPVSTMLVNATTGVLTSTISSNVTGTASTGTATGSTSVANLNAGILSTAGIPLISITDASALTSSSTASGQYGALNVAGTTSIAGLDIKVLGIDVTAFVEASGGALVDVSAVAGLSALAGLEIGVNVQTIGGDGILSKSITTDDVLVSFGTGINTGSDVVSGQLAIGESQASIVAAVPEPASVFMVGIGVTLMAFANSRRHGSRRRVATS